MIHDREITQLLPGMGRILLFTEPDEISKLWYLSPHILANKQIVSHVSFFVK